MGRYYNDLKIKPYKKTLSEQNKLTKKGNNPKIFISYSHKDEPEKDRLMTHLNVLVQQNQIEIWEDRQIKVGEEWEKEIEKALNECQIAIFLVSANSLTSDFILYKEIETLLFRQKEKGIKIFPLIIKSCPWKQVGWLKKLQLRPQNGQPLINVPVGEEWRIDDNLEKFTNEISEIIKVTSAIQTTKEIEYQEKNNQKLHYLGHLNSKINHWIGRKEELKKITNWIETDEATIIGIRGTTGIGKSYLASKILKDQILPNFTFRFWASMNQSPSFNQLAREFLEKAEIITDYNRQDYQRSEVLEQAFFDYLHQNRSLLIIDNLETIIKENQEMPPKYEKFFTNWIESGENSCLFLTTQIIPKILQHEKWHVLKGLTDAQGMELLRINEVEGTDEELQQFSYRLGGHPKILELLGRKIKNSGATKTLQDLEDLHLDKLDEMLVQLEDQYHNKGTVKFAYILDQILAGLKSTYQKHFFELAAFVRPFSTKEASDGLFDLEFHETQEILDYFVNYSLLEKIEIGEGKEKREVTTYWFHPFVSSSHFSGDSF